MGLGCKPCGKWQSIFRKQANRLAAEVAANKKKSENVEKIKVSYKKEDEIT